MFLTSNLQHKKSLRMKFSTARKTFDKRLRYYERQYNKNIIANIETVSSSNPREFWPKIKTHCQCKKNLSIYLFINKMKNIMEPPFKCILLSLAYFLYYFLKKSLVIFTVVGNSQRTPKCIFCIYIIEYNFNSEQLNGLEIIKSF